MKKISSFPHFRLLILGAGFSQPAGLPLGQDLLRLVRDQQHGEHSTLEEEIKEWEKLYPSKNLELEHVLAYSHVKHYLGIRGPEEYFAHGSQTIVAARTAIQQILVDRTPLEIPPLYQSFAQNLTPNDAVLTFNYDTLLEQTLDSIQKPYTLTPEWWLKRELPESGQEYVDLLKLHGSIDWYDREYHDYSARWQLENGHTNVPDRDPIFGPHPLVCPEPLNKDECHEHLGRRIIPRVFRVPKHLEYFPLGNHGHPFNYVVPFMLPLSHNKLMGHEPILDLWESLDFVRNHLTSIIVIGYSMPQYDSYAYEVLGRICYLYQSAGRKTGYGNRRVPIQIITMAESKTHVLNAMPFLDPSQTLIWPHGFSEQSLEWIDWGDGYLHKQS